MRNNRKWVGKVVGNILANERKDGKANGLRSDFLQELSATAKL